MEKSSYNGMIEYYMTCKECDWSFTTDSTVEISSASKHHRQRHDFLHRAWMNKYSEIRAESKSLEEKISMAMERKERLLNAEELIADIDENVEKWRARLEELGRVVL